MNSPLPTLSAIGFAAFLVACASVQPNAYLEESRVYVDSTESMRGVADIAGGSMNEARKNLEQANSLHAEGAPDDIVNHYALLARKHAEVGRERLAMAEAQRELDNAANARQELLLAARERRARLAESEALSAKAEAELMALEANVAREEARQAKEEALAASEQARLAQEQLNQAQADADQMARELDELKAKASARGIVLTLEDIVFAFDSAELQPGGERVVGRIAEFLEMYDERQVLIEGHTDSVGSAEYNQTLSERRADSVRQALIEQGIDSLRVRTRGLGENYPVASNENEAGRQTNRRVELIVANKDGEAVDERSE